MKPIALSDAARGRLDGLGQRFLAEFYERALDRRPADVEVLSELGHVYTRLGRLTEGLAVDRRLVDLRPEDPIARYNLACSLALTGARDEAFRALEAAVELGYDDAAYLREDDDLAALRDDPRFEALAARLAGEPGQPT